MGQNWMAQRRGPCGFLARGVTPAASVQVVFKARHCLHRPTLAAVTHLIHTGINSIPVKPVSLVVFFHSHFRIIFMILFLLFSSS